MALGACAMRRHNVVLAMLLMGSARSEPVYSMVLSSNSPAKFRLAQLSTTTGMATTIGPEHSEVIACGDLVATANGLLFYLGDTTAGAMLVALNLTTGEKSCEAPVNLEEIKLVGLGQTLDYDSTTNTLVLSGIARSGGDNAHESEHRRNGNISHVVFRELAAVPSARWGAMGSPTTFRCFMPPPWTLAGSGSLSLCRRVRRPRRSV